MKRALILLLLAIFTQATTAVAAPQLGLAPNFGHHEGHPCGAAAVVCIGFNNISGVSTYRAYGTSGICGGKKGGSTNVNVYLNGSLVGARGGVNGAFIIDFVAPYGTHGVITTSYGRNQTRFIGSQTVAACGVKATPTPTATFTPFMTPSPRSTPSVTATYTPRHQSTPTPSPTASSTPTQPVVTNTATATATPRRTDISEENTPTRTATPTYTPRHTNTPEQATPTRTATPEVTNTKTPKPTKTAVVEVTPTRTATPEVTNTKTPKPTKTAGVEITPTKTPKATKTPKPTRTPGVEPTRTAGVEVTVTKTPKPTKTATPTCTVEAPRTPTAVVVVYTPTPGAAHTPLPQVSPTPTCTPESGGQQGDVRVSLKCYDQRGDTLVYHFRSQTESSASVTVPIGELNKFAPGPHDQGQPTTFPGGTTENVFEYHTTYRGEMEWDLLGRGLTFSPEKEQCRPPCTSGHCADRACVHVDVSKERKKALALAKAWTRQVTLKAEKSNKSKKLRTLRQVKKLLAQLLKDEYPEQFDACTNPELCEQQHIGSTTNDVMVVIEKLKAEAKALGISKDVAVVMAGRVEKALRNLPSFRSQCS